MLKIIQVGNNEASNRYIRNKMKAVEKAGLEATLIKLPEDVSEGALIKEIMISACAGDTAIMVQLPLPKHINEVEVLSAIPTTRDIDGLNPKSDFMPLTPAGIMRWIKDQGIKLRGKTVTIFGRSNLVGKPLAMAMIEEGATVAVLNSTTSYFFAEKACRESDIIITATGRRGVLKPYYIAPGQTIIDVGINTDENGKLCGDVSQEARDWAKRCDSYVTPVPGGVGKWTVNELVIRLKEMEDAKVV